MSPNPLLDRLLSDRADTLTDRELIVLLLGYAGDRTPEQTATHLLEHFQDATGLLSARSEQLCAAGMTPRTALLFGLLFPLYRRCAAPPGEPAEEFRSIDRIGAYLTNLYIGIQVETVYLMLLNERYRLIDCIKLGEGAVNQAGINFRTATEHAIFRNARMAVLAHNHPGGVPTPSRDDVETTLRLKAAFEVVGVTLLDHLVIAGGRYLPILMDSRYPLSQNLPDYSPAAPDNNPDSPQPH